LLATFCALHLGERSINVISLAGLAFAVGMVVEGAIVVSGNIIRLRETGMPIEQAAHDGTRQVVPALFASTTTTIAVFLPVLFLEDVEGQIFADLALTISIAVAFSILVAITVVPAAAGRLLGSPARKSGYGEGWPRLTDKVIEWTRTRRQQVMWVLALLVLPLALSWLFLPKLDYLPPVKRAAIDASFSFPPGMSPATVDREIVSKLQERMQPYMTGEKQPRLKNYYVLLWPGGGTLGARVIDEKRIGELERIVRDEVVVGLPDTRVFVNEGELFGGIGGSARSVAIHLQTSDTAALNAAGAAGRRLLEQTFPGANVQSLPNTDVQVLELRAEPDDRRIAEVGWDRAALGTIIRSLGDGAWLGEYFDGQARLPVMLRTNLGETPEDIAQAPLITPSGEVVPLGELVTLETRLVPEQIRRVDHNRTVTLTIDPPATLSLEDMLTRINNEIVPKLRADLPADANIRLAGSADRLDTIVGTMSGNFLLALLVLFMLMAAMFHSLRDALVVVLTVPLALAGGVLGIRLLDLVTFQPLDLLTMIGFIMMIGIIVNHAILLVDLTRDAMNHGHSLEEALRMSLNQRLRAMVASTLTGALGALPMVVNPGPASTIYRGLAAVNVAGVIVSMVFSIVLLPSLMRLVYERRAPATATDDASLLPETAQ
jgi:multidrug efflux pump subunit AcrB